MASMFSLSPGIPGIKEQIPLTSSLIFTPAELASYNLSINSMSDKLFIFNFI